MSNIIDITSPEHLAKVVSENPVVVGDFWAEWCPPCRQLSPIIDKMAEEYDGTVTVVKVDVDKNPELSEAFNVMSIPTVIAWKGSLEGGMGFIGLKPYAAVKEFVDQRIAN